MKVILKIKGGFAPYLGDKELEFSPESLREETRGKAESLFSKDYLSSASFVDVPEGSADSRQITIDLIDQQGKARIFEIDEASCPAEFLNLIDEIENEIKR